MVVLVGWYGPVVIFVQDTLVLLSAAVTYVGWHRKQAAVLFIEVRTYFVAPLAIMAKITIAAWPIA